jgi:hypothetical protein
MTAPARWPREEPTEDREKPITLAQLQRDLLAANLPDLVINTHPRTLHHPTDTE